MQAPAYWPESLCDDREQFAVVCFRKGFTLPEKTEMRLWLGASQRFELYLDGQLRARGPSRSDRYRWHVTPVDLGPVEAGEHVLAVRVIHFGDHAGVGQMGPGAFLLVADELGDPSILAEQPWRSMRDESITPIDKHHWPTGGPYYVVGCGEEVDASGRIGDWTAAGFDDSSWPEPKVICQSAHDPWGNIHLRCLFRPDPLEQMTGRTVRFTRLVACPSELQAEAENWLAGLGELQVAANQTVRLVLDAGELRNVWPRLVVSGGKGAKIRWVGSEAPYTGDGREKAHRDDAAGREFYGHLDRFLPDGQTHVFTTGWYRSFRYAELLIETAAEAIRLEDVTLETTCYPLQETARIDPGPDDPLQLSRILDVSWRSIRLCARETFYDCPHYEQAQFPGDTRIQAIFHYLLADNDTLGRKAIDDFYGSRMPGGLTQCRWPSRRDQILPTFSLQWVGMLEDFRLYRGDAAWLGQYLHAAREVVDWFTAHLRDDGLLGLIPHAPFIDWSDGLDKGNAPQDPDGGSAVLTAMLAAACVNLSRLETFCGYAVLAPMWLARAARLNRAVGDRCWRDAPGMLADTPSGQSCRVHAQCEALGPGALAGPRAAGARQAALDNSDVAQPGSFYYQFYVLEALKRAGLAGQIPGMLPLWTDKLDETGLTTWPETFRPNSRSDCHAWSVAPSMEIIQTLLGIRPDPAEAGFGKAIFNPTLPEGLDRLSGRFSTPSGLFEVSWQRGPEGISARLFAPVETRLGSSGRILPAGRHELRLD